MVETNLCRYLFDAKSYADIADASVVKVLTPNLCRSLIYYYRSRRRRAAAAAGINLLF